ncbi:MAG: hypothetical protein DRP30_06595 [Thermotoga sp.]|nr:MAG: hypothetical protein DRP30_06595 [Thermotoga sp.]
MWDFCEFIVRNRDKNGIAKFIKERFTERYISPVKDGKQKSGFAIMALSCLMIEALESFRDRWKSTRNKSKKAFKSLRNSCSIESTG